MDIIIRSVCFGLGGPLFLLDRFDDRFFGFDDACEGRLLGLYLVGGLIFGTEPADQAVAFFFGALGVEGDEAFEEDVVEALRGGRSPLSPPLRKLSITHKYVERLL